MVFDLEKALSETIAEFKKRIEQNLDLGSEFSGLPTHSSMPGEEIILEGKNMFDVQSRLVRQMKKAYQNEDIEALNRITKYGNEDPSGNSITFFLYGAKYNPFGNETTGENIYWITYIFGQLAKAGKTTEFYEYLCKEIKQFQTERNAIRDEILSSEGFNQLASKNLDPWKNIDDRLLLRKIYREEEFKRINKVIDLCNKAEELYGLASRLFEGIRIDS